MMNGYTRKEAATLCGVSDETIWRWYKDGRFPNARVERRHGRQTMIIPRDDLVANGALVTDVSTAELALEPETGLLRTELAAAKALIAHQDSEITHLRGVVEALSRR